jgi:hypothetical protein
MRNGPHPIALILLPCAVLVCVGCFCAAGTVSLFGGLGDQLANRFGGWFRSPAATLADALLQRQAGMFRLNRCAFSNEKGNVIDSSLSNDSGGYGQALTPEQVAAYGAGRLEGRILTTRRGEVRLEGIPMLQTALQPDGSLLLNLSQSGYGQDGISTWSYQAEGEARDREYSGNLRGSEDSSGVVDGHGYTRAAVYSASFICQIEKLIR